MPDEEEFIASLVSERPDEFRAGQEVSQLRASSALDDSDIDDIANELSLSEIDIREKCQEVPLQRSRKDI